MKLKLYHVLARLCDLLRVEHSFRRRIGGITGAATRRANKTRLDLQKQTKEPVPTVLEDLQRAGAI